MKKSILILAIIILPTLAFSASCYTDWLDTYNEAESQYAEDNSYCFGRSVDWYVYTCFTWASLDYGDRLNQGEDQYQKCISDSTPQRTTSSGRNR